MPIPAIVQKASKINIYKALRSKAEESKNEIEKRKADIARTEQMYQVKQRTQWIDQ